MATTTTPVYSRDDAEVLIETAINDFINWLYEHGPNPDTMPREKLYRMYLVWVQNQ